MMSIRCYGGPLAGWTLEYEYGDAIAALRPGDMAVLGLARHAPPLPYRLALVEDAATGAPEKVLLHEPPGGQRLVC